MKFFVRLYVVVMYILRKSMPREWCRGVNRTAMTYKSSERLLTVTVAARVQSGGSEEIEGEAFW